MRGMAMGIAEVIPGVSGGTIAFITGIYEKLLDSIQQFDKQLLQLLLKGKFILSVQKVNGGFLSFLLLGMGLGILIGLVGISYILASYPEPLWAFFFGLILASCYYIGRKIEKWKMPELVALVTGIILTYLITAMIPAQGSENLIIVFLSGMIAISALLLPGISGSFILLLLGMYSIIIPNLKGLLIDFELHRVIIVGIFALGCLVGILSFSRLLSAAFHKYNAITLAAMTGIMLGSLNKIWPWRNPFQWLDKESLTIVSGSENLGMITANAEQYKILREANVLPSNYMSEPLTFICIICFILGLAIVLGMMFSEKTSKA